MTLTCCSAGVPPPQYAWYKRNLITFDPELLTNSVGVFSSTLYVPITGAADSGVYICIAFNSGGTSFMEFLVELVPEGKPIHACISIVVYGNIEEGTLVPGVSYLIGRLLNHLP